MAALGLITLKAEHVETAAVSNAAGVASKAGTPPSLRQRGGRVSDPPAAVDALQPAAASAAVVAAA